MYWCNNITYNKNVVTSNIILVTDGGKLTIVLQSKTNSLFSEKWNYILKDQIEIIIIWLFHSYNTIRLKFSTKLYAMWCSNLEI